MKKLNPKPALKLDAGEQALLNAFEAGELNRSSLTKTSLEKFKLAATETMIKKRLLEKPSNLARNAD
ncbi:MAG: hypothetical protein ABL923_10215 [Burkholderiaceae bacterium]